MFARTDNYWPELAGLLPEVDGHPPVPGKMAASVIENAALAALYFDMRCKAFIKTWLTGALASTYHWWRYEWQARGSSHAHGCCRLATPQAAMLTTWSYHALLGFCASQQLLERSMPAAPARAVDAPPAPAGPRIWLSRDVPAVVRNQLLLVQDTRRAARAGAVFRPTVAVAAGTVINHDLITRVNAWDLILNGQDCEEHIRAYADSLVSTMHPDAAAAANAALPHDRALHPCRRAWLEVGDTADEGGADVPTAYADDYILLLNAVEQHARCTPSYCLHAKPVRPSAPATSLFTHDDPDADTHRQLHEGPNQCRFGFPKLNVPTTRLSYREIRDGTFRVQVVTRRNHRTLNSHNLEQLQHWRYVATLGSRECPLLLTPLCVCVFALLWFPPLPTCPIAQRQCRLPGRGRRGELHHVHVQVRQQARENVRRGHQGVPRPAQRQQPVRRGRLYAHHQLPL